MSRLVIMKPLLTGSGEAGLACLPTLEVRFPSQGDGDNLAKVRTLVHLA
jgi:hypothetical protein